MSGSTTTIEALLDTSNASIQLLADWKANISAASSQTDLERLKGQLVGKEGEIPALLKAIPTLSDPVQKKSLGQIANRLKVELEAAIAARMEVIRSAAAAAKAAEKALDVTMPGRPVPEGHVHPLIQTLRDIEHIFYGMGFTRADGPLVETVWHNFDALNTPDNHPARDLQDTFYLDDSRLLRTHTSSVQIRTMMSQDPPVRIIAPGPCFRKDAVDPTHYFTFCQVEGLYVDRGVTLADLKGTIAAFAKALLGERVKVRFRPHFFPFTEPSVEYDFSCVFCGGKGCRVCKGSGWIEISGAGMVHPNVLRNVGYDPQIWSGYAWGMGVERVTMLRHAIDDIRLFYDNDLRFLEQFR